MQNKPGAIIIEGHVQGLANTRALGKKGIPVYVVDTSNCVARYSKYCKKFFHCPDYKSDHFARFLIKLATEEKINGWVLLPSNDHAVYTISKYKDQISKYYKTVAPNYTTLKNIYNKENLINIAESTGIPAPDTEYFDNPDEIKTDLTFPVITKGKEGLSFYKATGKKAFSASSRDELEEQLFKTSEYISLEHTFTQEKIPFDGKNHAISFTSFSINGNIQAHWSGQKLLQHPLQYGTATLAESIKNKSVLEHSEKLLEELNFTGVCEIEYILDPRDNKYKLIEINPRTWLWVELAIRNGIDYPWYIYCHLNAIDIEYPKDYKSGLKWSNPYTNTVYGLLAILKNKYSIKEIVDLNSGRKINALYDKYDLKPFLSYAYLLLNMVKNR